MTENVQAYPLQWPLNRPRAQSRRRDAPFRKGAWSQRQRHTFNTVLQQVLKEIRLMGGKDTVVSSNLRLRKDGLPFSDQAQPADPGIAVYFTHKDRPICMACDYWAYVEDNMRAIALTLDAIRGMARWGAAEVEATFTGYAALPAPAPTALWSEVLGVERFCKWDDVEAAYREKAKVHHPDRGGKPDDWYAIQTAYEQAKQERGR